MHAATDTGLERLAAPSPRDVRPRRRMRSLAGTCGIPREAERVYVGVFLVPPPHADAYSQAVPRRVTWPDGRSWEVERAKLSRTFGVPYLGTYVERWEVYIRRRSRTLWWEAGRWFVVPKIRRGYPQSPCTR